MAHDSEGLQVIDVSNPAAPVQVGSFDTAGTARGVAVAGGYVYVADDDGALVILQDRDYFCWPIFTLAP